MDKDIKYASIGKRSVSLMIDDFIVSTFFVIIFFDQIKVLSTPDSMLAFIRANIWVLLALQIIYHAFLVAYNGTTLGKLAVGLRVVDEDNISSTISYINAFIRSLIRMVGENFLLYITFIYAFLTPKKQALHDRFSKSIVIDVRS